jgi:hypothetical protein
MSAMRDFWQKLPRPADAPDDDTDADDDESAEPMQAPAPAKGGKKAPSKAPPKVQKTYVKVGPIQVIETFDDKYKDTLPPVIEKALADAVNASAKLTTDAQDKGFHAFGSFTLKRSGKEISGHLEVVLATFPDDSFFANAHGGASSTTGNPKYLDDDVNAVIAAILPGVQKNMIAALEARAP